MVGRTFSGRYVTDRSEASGTGHYSAAQSRYLPEILAHVDAGRDWTDALPEVMDASTAVGTVADPARTELGLAPGTLVGPGGGDQHAAALGLGIARGDVVYTFGTSGVVFTTSESPVFDPGGIVDGVADMTDGWLPRYVFCGPARGPLASGPGMTVPPCRTDDLGGGVTGSERRRWRR